MANIKYKNNFFNNLISLTNKKIFIFFFFIKFKLILSNYFESFKLGNISNNASIVDVTDYNDLYPLITTDKQIFTGMTPIKRSETNSSLINISAALTYNNNFILLACSKNYLLSKIDINTGEEISLLSYNIFDLSIDNLNYSCSICYSNNIAYVGIIQIMNKTLQKNIIKIELEQNNNIITIKKHYIYTLDYLLPILKSSNFTRQFSCEIITPTNYISDEALVCGYIIYDNSTSKYKYRAIALNSQFNKINSEINIKDSDTLLGFRLQKINSTYIRYLVTKNSYEIYIIYETIDFQNYILKKVPNNLTNLNLQSFTSLNELFYYHNQHIFSSSPQDSKSMTNFYLYLKSNISNNSIRCTFS